MDHTKSFRRGLFLVRLALAAVFVTHGVIKFMDMPKTIAFFATLGFGVFVVYFVATVEVLAGLLMLIGKFTALAGYALAIDMLVAIIKVRWPHGFVGGYEFELVLLLCALGVAISGVGRPPEKTQSL